MTALIVRIAAMFGISISPVIAGAILFGAALGGAGLYTIKVYEAGRSSAEGKCQAAALQSKIKAMEKDRDNARRAAADAALKLATIEAQAKEEQERTADYVEELKNRPAPSCALTCDDLRGMRIASKSCPAGPRAAAGAGKAHGAGRSTAR
ncbi:hypothetical protein [Bradyrhizobium japonicum]|uniref:hypothetical protein n=1 Tax=Bradyrhizobium japonicum TaxID=375 RepID=UPI0004065048|nr:hypothetical protein [Bradyrhizobium japonicum]